MDLHDPCFEEAFRNPGIQGGTTKFDPILNPSDIGIGTVTVPIAGWEDKYGARTHLVSGFRKLKKPASLRDGHKLQGGKSAS
jgi:hypothetical protein